MKSSRMGADDFVFAGPSPSGSLRRRRRNKDEVAKEKERFYGWRLKKQQEEQKIADSVSYFVTENPITTGVVAAAPLIAGTRQDIST